MFRSTRLTAAALAGAILTTACSDSTGVGSGTLGVKLTNASIAASVFAAEVSDATESPLPAGSVKSVDIFVVRIDARRSEATDEEAAENSEESEAAEGGWVTIAEPNALLDLMTLGNGETAFLGEATVQAGAYNGFRLIIDPAKSSLTLNDEAGTVIGGESVVGLKFPSAAKTGIKIKLAGGPVEIEDGEESTLMVTFDVSRSFVMRGATIEQNGLLFKPVIRATQVEVPAAP